MGGMSHHSINAANEQDLIQRSRNNSLTDPQNRAPTPTGDILSTALTKLPDNMDVDDEDDEEDEAPPTIKPATKKIPDKVIMPKKFANAQEFGLFIRKNKDLPLDQLLPEEPDEQ